MSNKKTSFKRCAGCPYNTGSTSTPIGLENNGSRYLLVFQAPGKDEWNGNTNSKQRIPIDSENPHSAANRMRKSFDRKNKKRKDYDITEAVQCYPGQNTNKRDKKPRKSSQNICKKYLKEEISNNNYTDIFCFGKIAYDIVKDILENIKTNKKINCVEAAHPSSNVSNSALDNSYK